MQSLSIHLRIQYLQIAAHEGIIPIEEQYRICEIARELTLEPEFLVGRVIARPFVGEPGNFTSHYEPS